MTRKHKDIALNGLVYVFSSISVFVLLSLFWFIFNKGFSSLSIDLFTRTYWSENTIVEFKNTQAGSFSPPITLPEGAVFSNQYGFALIDSTNPQHEAQLELVYIDPDSPILEAENMQVGHEGEAFVLTEGLWIQKFSYLNSKDVVRSAGNLMEQSAQETIDSIEMGNGLVGAFVQTQGGGIFGSLVATLLLILVSLTFSLPIGVGAAIYLNEYAYTSKWTPWLRSSIELLTGVPSIIYGLMGVLVIFPITAFFGAQGTSILLGGLTLSIVLLPVIIRTTEESLKVVPQNFRDASLSLGANTSQTIFKIVIPSALPGILTATLLSVGRIIGESAALIYTMGTFVSDKPQLMQGATSLAVQIWSIMSGEQPNFELASAISIIIVVIVLMMNFIVKTIGRRLQKTW